MNITDFGNWLGLENGKNMISSVIQTDCTAEQARAAVTTFCILFGIEVDTKAWDDLMNWLHDCYDSWFDTLDELDEFMCADLI